MSGILILGASGHGKVVADIVLSSGHSVIGFLDDDPRLVGTTVLGFPVLGGITSDVLRLYPADGLVMGVGSNSARQRIVERLEQAARVTWLSFVHARASVSPFARIEGAGTIVGAASAISPAVVLGSHVIINTGAIVADDSRIGSYAHIAPGASLAGAVTVGEGALVGVGATVLPGRSIGAWATVGAGAVVVEDVPAGVVAKGVPARW